MPKSDAEWKTLRDEVMLDPNYYQLNAGSFSPVARPVFEKLNYWRERQANCPSNFFWRDVPPELDRARERLAKYIGTPTSNLLLIPNATFGINIAVKSLDLGADAEVLMTDQEYGACRFAWLDEQSRRKFAIREAPIPIRAEDPNEIVEAIERAIGPKTKVLFFSHVTSPTGLILPAKELCELAAKRGILTVIDGAHAPGMIPLNMEDIGADFYTGNCHKWMMAPSGAAFLNVAKQHHSKVKPVMISWGWDFDRAKLEDVSGWGGSFWQRNVEFMGTIDRCAIMVLPEVLDFREKIGDENVRERVNQLAAYGRGAIANVGLDPATPASRKLGGAMTAFEVPKLDTVKARDWIWNTHKVEAPFNTSAGKYYFRISTAWFTLPSEIDRAAEAIATLPVDKLQ